jgi:hypothetical protein
MTLRCITAVAALGTAFVAISCGYPTFEFDPKGSGGQSSATSSSVTTGGMGGAASTTTSAQSSATSSASASSTATSAATSGTGGAPGCALDHLVISEIRSRGAAQGFDEFIELYNPTASAVTLDAGWLIEGRSAAVMTYAKRWQGSGKSIPAHGHYLIVGTNYTQQPPKDDMLSGGITDAASLRLSYLAATVDAVCYSFDSATATDLADPTFTCEGAPASNLPHNDMSTPQSNIDASLERRNQGCLDDDQNLNDFKAISPAQPENTMSPPVP